MDFAEEMEGVRELTRDAAALRMFENAMERAMDTVLCGNTFAQACKAVGIDPPAAVVDGPGLESKRVTAHVRLKSGYYKDSDSALLLAASAVDLAGYRPTVSDVEAITRTSFSEGARHDLLKLEKVREKAVKWALERQSEIGVIGTRHQRGRIQVEQNSRMAPFQVRGRGGNPKLYDEMYRTDGVTFRNTNEITGLAVAGIFEPKIPREYDERESEMVRRIDRAIKRARCGGPRGGWKRIKRNAMQTALINGVSPFEVCWETKSDGLIAPWKLEPRMPATIEGWAFDERGSELAGAEFYARVDGEVFRYYLPAGSDPMTARLALVTLNDVGADVEGVPPTRPNVGIRKLKELVLQCYGIGMQKHGAPIALVFLELVDATIAELGAIGTDGHKTEIQKLLTRLRDIRSRLAAVLPVPLGTRVEFLVPANKLPNPVEILKYFDFLMGIPYANEGALLGQSSGSYALSAAKTESFMRSAPAYALAFAEMLEGLMRVALEANLGYEPESFPEYGIRFAGTQNGSQWLNDWAAASNARIGDAPAPVQEQAESILGLPPGSLADMTVSGNEGRAVVENVPNPDGRANQEQDDAQSV